MRILSIEWGINTPPKNTNFNGITSATGDSSQDRHFVGEHAFVKGVLACHRSMSTQLEKSLPIKTVLLPSTTTHTTIC